MNLSYKFVGPIMRHRNACHTVTRLRLPGYGYQITVTRLGLPSYDYQVTVTRLRLPGYGYQITVTRLRLPGYGFPPEMTTGPATLYKCIRIQSCFHKILGMF